MTAALRVVAVTLAVLLVVVVLKYQQQQDAITEACAQTAAAAKLDLSGMVPLCKQDRRYRQ